MQAIKLKTPMIISPIAGVRKTTVGSVVSPGTLSHEHPTGGGDGISEHFEMQYSEREL